MPVGAANKKRRERQETLREALAKAKHHEHVVEILDELRDSEQVLTTEMVARLKIVIDTKIKLISKYLPDLKAVEHTGEAGEDLTVQLTLYAEPKDFGQ